jgi:hypothetical protein
MWKTGEFITSDVRNENFFSADNWGVRSSQLLPSVRGLSDVSWDTIYDNALATFKIFDDSEPDAVKASTADLIERFEMLRSDPDYLLPEPSVNDDGGDDDGIGHSRDGSSDDGNESGGDGAGESNDGE